jgi:ZIP family zinc transporter
MTPLVTVILYTLLAGFALPAGGLLARIERLRPNWLEQEFRHGVLAFGGGILLAAVALVLVPEGTRELDALTATGSLLVGGAALLLTDRTLARTGTTASNFMAALLDFLPEAIALGALIASEPALGALLAAFIGLQNIPEGFNAYRELAGPGGIGARSTLALLTLAALLGPIAGILGYWTLADAPQATGITMLVASGGILYLVFQDIAPQAKLSRHWGPPLGAVLGFALGLAGTMLLRL